MELIAVLGVAFIVSPLIGWIFSPAATGSERYWSEVL